MTKGSRKIGGLFLFFVIVVSLRCWKVDLKIPLGAEWGQAFTTTQDWRQASPWFSSLRVDKFVE